LLFYNTLYTRFETRFVKILNVNVAADD